MFYLHLRHNSLSTEPPPWSATTRVKVPTILRCSYQVCSKAYSHVYLSTVINLSCTIGCVFVYPFHYILNFLFLVFCHFVSAIIVKKNLCFRIKKCVCCLFQVKWSYVYKFSLVQTLLILWKRCSIILTLITHLMPAPRQD